MPRVSVVIPAYNAAPFIREAIESVLNQTSPPNEVIVVDDGSTDETAAVVESFGPQVQCLRRRNQGVSSARNHGAGMATSEWVAFLDADDAWRPEKLEAQLQLTSVDGTGFVHCGSEKIDRDGRHLCYQLDGLSGDIAAGMLLFAGNHANGSTTLVRRELFSASGGYDPALSTSADWDLCFRIGRLGRLSFVPRPLALYRQHGANMHANPALMERDMLRAYKKALDTSDADLLALRRRACSALHLMLAGSFSAYGERSRAIHHGLWAILWRPESGLSLIEGLWRSGRRSVNGGHP